MDYSGDNMKIEPERIAKLKQLMEQTLELPRENLTSFTTKPWFTGWWVSYYVYADYDHNELMICVLKSDVVWGQTGKLYISPNHVQLIKTAPPFTLSVPRISTEEEYFQQSTLHDLTNLDLDFFLTCNKLYSLCCSLHMMGDTDV